MQFFFIDFFFPFTNCILSTNIVLLQRAQKEAFTGILIDICDKSPVYLPLMMPDQRRIKKFILHGSLQFFNMFNKMFNINENFSECICFKNYKVVMYSMKRWIGQGPHIQFCINFPIKIYKTTKVGPRSLKFLKALTNPYAQVSYI